MLKAKIPDMHTDFAYSAAAEEYGLWLSLLIIALFGFLVIRGLQKALRSTDSFEQVAAAGLFAMIGMQAFINVVVNLGLAPTKGMTLPFISYGGSSMLAMCPTAGMAQTFPAERGVLLALATARRGDLPSAPRAALTCETATQFAG